MFKSIFVLYLLLHLIGDFILQSDMHAKKKEQGFPHVVLHGLRYAFPFLMTSLFVQFPGTWLIQATVLSVAHLIVDTMKYILLKHRPGNNACAYVVDQSIHLTVLAAMAFVTIELWQDVRAANWMYRVLSTLEIDGMDTLSWICILLAVGKPANITIRQILSLYKPPVQEATKMNTGAMIGTLERIIMLLLLGMGQYAAIALVLTAKSIARYDMLKDKVFAEYYLVGTLLSTLSVLIASILFAP